MLSKLQQLEKIALRTAVLEYFNSKQPKYARKMQDDAVFANYDAEDVKEMLHALTATGDLRKLAGEKAGSQYIISVQGRNWLEAQREAV